MKPEDVQKAREKLGLSLADLATLLGFQGAARKQQGNDLCSGRRRLTEPHRRLLEAYLRGYRPRDWPK